jgi:hypothetical protein
MKKKKTIVLLVRDNMVCTAEPVDESQEADLDKLMQGIAIAKSVSMCG